MLNEEKVIMNRDMVKMCSGGSCGLGFCQYSHPYFMMNNLAAFITLITQAVLKRFNQL
jgi:hypothetical protein